MYSETKGSHLMKASDLRHNGCALTMTNHRMVEDHIIIMLRVSVLNILLACLLKIIKITVAYCT